MIPALPEPAIRAAVQCGDWNQAERLLSQFDLDVRRALPTADLRAERDAWQQLLEAQQHLLADLKRERDEAGAALARLGHEHRGMRAYLQEA
ncbi:hypothetical protein [Lysobacter niastensis]|uniref:Flagellar protein FliT n=1 Tax=Lysobacter niastensis TaxID=380629 RepID=A0ABS0B9A5_9GAMM|nr:hypothetical protein [Lysobacter niastensis]MBF6025600.1 hypothetical protein [Lysobacter niastensis]